MSMDPGSAAESGMDDRGYRIHGRVQGVGFRWWSRGVARKLGVVGTVANRADGSVEVMARGTVHSIARLEVALREGPTMARVDRVEVVDCTLPDVVDTFSIEL